MFKSWNFKEETSFMLRREEKEHFFREKERKKWREEKRVEKFFSHPCLSVWWKYCLAFETIHMLFSWRAFYFRPDIKIDSFQSNWQLMLVLGRICPRRQWLWRPLDQHHQANTEWLPHNQNIHQIVNMKVDPCINCIDLDAVFLIGFFFIHFWLWFNHLCICFWFIRFFVLMSLIVIHFPFVWIVIHPFVFMRFQFQWCWIIFHFVVSQSSMRLRLFVFETCFKHEMLLGLLFRTIERGENSNCVNLRKDDNPRTNFESGSRIWIQGTNDWEWEGKEKNKSESKWLLRSTFLLQVESFVFSLFLSSLFSLFPFVSFSFSRPLSLDFYVWNEMDKVIEMMWWRELREQLKQVITKWEKLEKRGRND